MQNNSVILLKHPRTFIVYGPSRSGKTKWCEKLLFWMNEMFGFYFEQILYCSGEYFPDYDTVHGIKLLKVSSLNENIIRCLNSNNKNLIIIDDNMNNVVNDILISDLFTKISHHKNITVILLMQNLFPKGKYMRYISTNSTYMILMANTRETLQIQILSSQIDGANSKFILNCFNDATKNKPFSYLLLDFDQNTPDEMRVRTNIFPDEEPKFVYTKLPKV